MLNGDTETVVRESNDKNQNGLEDGEADKKVTPYERLSQDLTNDPRVLKEITLGKRIGFYRIRGELGSGNFSQVKMGIHALTKGINFFFGICLILGWSPQFHNSNICCMAIVFVQVVPPEGPEINH